MRRPRCSTSPTALGAEMRLAAFGLSAADLERAADLAVESPYPNPAPVTREGVRALLQDAYEGRRPVESAEDEMSEAFICDARAHADRALWRRARRGARRRPRRGAAQGAAGAPSRARPGRDRRRDPRLRQPGGRGQPERRAHGAAARRPAGERAGRHGQPPVRLGHGGDRPGRAGDQGGRGRA